MTDPRREQPTTDGRPDGLPHGRGVSDDPAWWADMTAWTDDRLAGHGIRRHGPLVPVRVWVRSAVATFETDRGRMWAKAVPDLFSHEIALTELIADIDPGAAPPVVAAERDRGRILTDHVEGPALTEVAEAIAWTATLARMAELQRVLAADRTALEMAGVAAAPLDRLADRIPALLHDDHLLGVGRPSGLTAAEAASVRARTGDLVGACLALAGSPLPESLDHGDLGPAQVIIGDMGPVFLDWSDGSITHPFLAAASFLAVVERAPASVPATVEAIADAYLVPWLAPTGLSLAEARSVLALAQTVHPLHIAALYADRVLPGLLDAAPLDQVVPDHLRTLS